MVSANCASAWLTEIGLNFKPLVGIGVPPAASPLACSSQRPRNSVTCAGVSTRSVSKVPLGRLWFL